MLFSVQSCCSVCSKHHAIVNTACFVWACVHGDNPSRLHLQ